ncbi:MAG TPA: DUF2244 domain-containing protein [Burkholderiales bacterium]|nr:DUF2244 domain-containing protein [Burkholderiales bacterium]
MSDSALPCPEQRSYLIKRNCSIAPLPCLAFLLGLSLLALAVGTLWAWKGAWPVLVFVLIEVGGIVSAVLVWARHAGDYERIVFERDRLIVEVFERGHLDRHEFDRRWTRLVTDAGGSLRLAVRCHNREVEVGRHLDEARRSGLAAELGKNLPPIQAPWW